MTADVRHERLLVRVLDGVLQQETFDTLPDLVEALKCACARYRIAYDGAACWRAITRLEHGRQRLLLSRADARAILQELGIGQ